MIRTMGVAHFTIPVTDTERSLTFYTEILGMTAVQVNHERGMVFLDSGGDCIILARSAQAADPEEHDLHHAFIVAADEYEDAKAFLAERGVEIFFEEDRQGGAVNGPRAYFHDPDGNVLEIINLTSYKGTETPGAGSG